MIHSTDQFYQAGALDYFQRTVSVDLSSIYSSFLGYVRPAGRILDAGCGSGRDLKAFKARGYDVLGMDASPALVTLASEWSGAACLTMRFEDLEFRECFDAIWACASLLHVPKPQLQDVLVRFKRALVPSGVMFASMQVGEGETVTEDGRFFAYYQQEEFVGVLQRAGFTIEKAWVTVDSLSDREGIRWINVIGRTGWGMANER